MKTAFAGILVAMAAALPTPSPAAAGHDHGAQAPAAPAAQPLAEGVVKKVDRAGNRVSVQHGPLPNGMPAMTMTFPLGKGVSVDQLKEGQKIRFAIEDANGVTRIVRVEPAK